MKAQGTVEYMALISSIITFSIIVITIMLNYIDSGRDAMIQESQDYWAIQVPISIIEWRQTETGVMYLIMKNKGLEEIVFYNISLDNYTLGTTQHIPMNSVFIINGTVGECIQGEMIEYTTVRIRYKPKGSNRVLENVKVHPIRVICS